MSCSVAGRSSCKMEASSFFKNKHYTAVTEPVILLLTNKKTLTHLHILKSGKHLMKKLYTPTLTRAGIYGPE